MVWLRSALGKRACYGGACIGPVFLRANKPAQQACQPSLALRLISTSLFVFQDPIFANIAPDKRCYCGYTEEELSKAKAAEGGLASLYPKVGGGV